jgi:hypothetical protein
VEVLQTTATEHHLASPALQIQIRGIKLSWVNGSWTLVNWRILFQAGLTAEVLCPALAMTDHG